MVMDDIEFSCVLEPDDERNFLKVEDVTTCISVTIQHMAYGFWYRLKCAFRILFKGYVANDLSLSEEDVLELLDWLEDWCWHKKKNNEIWKEYYSEEMSNEKN